MGLIYHGMFDHSPKNARTVKPQFAFVGQDENIKFLILCDGFDLTDFNYALVSVVTAKENVIAVLRDNSYHPRS